MDTTMQVAFNFIESLPEKHWRRRYWITKVNEEISQFRLTASKNRNTKIALYCNQQANILEKELRAITSRQIQ